MCRPNSPPGPAPATGCPTPPPAPAPPCTSSSDRPVTPTALRPTAAWNSAALDDIKAWGVSVHFLEPDFDGYKTV
jgi:hypothetical protein